MKWIKWFFGFMHWKYWLTVLLPTISFGNAILVTLFFEEAASMFGAFLVFIIIPVLTIVVGVIIPMALGAMHKFEADEIIITIKDHYNYAAGNVKKWWDLRPQNNEAEEKKP